MLEGSCKEKVLIRGHLWWSELRAGGNTGGSPCRVDGWWQNNETFAIWQEWMAHVKSVEQSDCGRCGALIKVAKCQDTMLWLYLGESEKVSQASSRARKNESGDIKSVKKRRAAEVARKPRRRVVSGHNVEIVLSESEKWSKHHHGRGKMNPAISIVWKTENGRSGA